MLQVSLAEVLLWLPWDGGWGRVVWVSKLIQVGSGVNYRGQRAEVRFMMDHRWLVVKRSLVTVDSISKFKWLQNGMVLSYMRFDYLRVMLFKDGSRRNDGDV